MSKKGEIKDNGNREVNKRGRGSKWRWSGHYFDIILVFLSSTFFLLLPFILFSHFLLLLLLHLRLSWNFLLLSTFSALFPHFSLFLLMFRISYYH